MLEERKPQDLNESRTQVLRCKPVRKMVAKQKKQEKMKKEKTRMRMMMKNYPYHYSAFRRLFIVSSFLFLPIQYFQKNIDKLASLLAMIIISLTFACLLFLAAIYCQRNFLFTANC